MLESDITYEARRLELKELDGGYMRRRFKPWYGYQFYSMFLSSFLERGKRKVLHGQTFHVVTCLFLEPALLSIYPGYS